MTAIATTMAAVAVIGDNDGRDDDRNDRCGGNGDSNCSVGDSNGGSWGDGEAMAAMGTATAAVGAMV